jgi:hypothetical protein
MTTRRLLFALAAVPLLSCAHAGIKNVSDCDQVAAELRLGCAACTVQNQAAGWIGEYEYRPDNKPDERCVRVK